MTITRETLQLAMKDPTQAQLVREFAGATDTEFQRRCTEAVTQATPDIQAKAIKPIQEALNAKTTEVTELQAKLKLVGEAIGAKDGVLPAAEAKKLSDVQAKLDEAEKQLAAMKLTQEAADRQGKVDAALLKHKNETLKDNRHAVTIMEGVLLRKPQTPAEVDAAVAAETLRITNLLGDGTKKKGPNANHEDPTGRRDATDSPIGEGRSQEAAESAIFGS